MAISALVVTLSRGTAAAEARAALDRDQRFMVGELTEDQLPLVLSTDSTADDRAGLEWLAELPGVDLVELACVYFEDREEAA